MRVFGKILFLFFKFFAVSFQFGLSLVRSFSDLGLEPTMISNLAQLRTPSIHGLSTKSLKASPSLACARITTIANSGNMYHSLFPLHNGS